MEFTLTTSDLSDLRDGHMINAMAVDGREMTIDGSDFNSADLALLESGKVVEIDDDRFQVES